MAKYWFGYIGTGDPTIAFNYRILTVKPGCLNGNVSCAIYAESGDGFPNVPLSDNLQQYITNALATLVAQPQDSGTAKKFVYLKANS